jgi:sporulation protein YlmC with PRC-barrel domain
VKISYDVLDKQLLDSEDEPMGRVDGLIMEVGEATQPRITHIAVGGTALWGRVHPVFARLSQRLARVWGPRRSKQVRIPWSRVKTAGRDIKLDVEGKETGAIDWEIWISRKIIKRIPGSGTDEEDDGSQS